MIKFSFLSRFLCARSIASNDCFSLYVYGIKHGRKRENVETINLLNSIILYFEFKCKYYSMESAQALVGRNASTQ